jgi:hypothetical protein
MKIQNNAYKVMFMIVCASIAQSAVASSKGAQIIKAITIAGTTIYTFKEVYKKVKSKPVADIKTENDKTITDFQKKENNKTVLGEIGKLLTREALIRTVEGVAKLDSQQTSRLRTGLEDERKHADDREKDRVVEAVRKQGLPDDKLLSEQTGEALVLASLASLGMGGLTFGVLEACFPS